MKKIICYGDSNTWGYEPMTDTRLPWEERWTGQLQRCLGEEYRVTEHGLCGRTTTDICTEEQSPHNIAIIMLGTNDCKDMYDVNPKTIADGVGRIGNIFKKKGQHTLLISPVWISNLKQSPFAQEFGLFAEEKSRQLHLYIEEEARMNGFAYMNAQDYAQAGTYDGIHLDRESHQKLASAIYTKILEMEGVV